MNIKTKIESLDHNGRGIAHYNGKVVFIANALPGEDVEVNIIEDKKKYATGKVIKYYSESPNRIKPLCPYYNECGGCQLSHLSYDNQLAYKKENVLNILNKYSNINPNIEVINSDNVYHYRNKITLKVVNYNWGYYSEYTHKFIAIDSCLIASEAINKIIKYKELFSIQDGSIVIRSNYNDEILINITTNNKYKIDVDKLKDTNKIVGILVNDKIICGEDSFIEIINKTLFKVNINSFFQVNVNILNKISEILNLEKYQNVIDLYCGVGTLGQLINKKKLYGIEINQDSIKDALINSKMNKQNNNNYLLGDSSKIINIEDNIDTLIIDPPRSGIDDKTINYIKNSKINDIIYMSCDALTLARDLDILKNNYLIRSFYLLDMFPQTYHIESLVFLKFK